MRRRRASPRAADAGAAAAGDRDAGAGDRDAAAAETVTPTRIRHRRQQAAQTLRGRQFRSIIATTCTVLLPFLSPSLPLSSIQAFTSSQESNQQALRNVVQCEGGP